MGWKRAYISRWQDYDPVTMTLAPITACAIGVGGTHRQWSSSIQKDDESTNQREEIMNENIQRTFDPIMGGNTSRISMNTVEYCASNHDWKILADVE